jgi:hypothetical protein
MSKIALSKPSKPKITTEDAPFPERSPQDIQPASSNPFTATDWRLWSYAWAGFGLRVFLMFGAVFSVYQYLAAREEQRVQRALELVELWEQPQYQEAQRALKKRITDLQTEFSAMVATQPTDSERKVVRDQIGIRAMSASGGSMPIAEFEEKFDRIVFFLNRLSFCVEGNLCSRAVVDANFRDFAASFWQYFEGYVARERKRGSPTFAKPLETYVRQGPAAR